MSQPFDFESVQYPMFKVTEEEKQELIRARAMPTDNTPEFLCVRINMPSLQSKIAKVLGGHGAVLENFTFPNVPTSNKDLWDNFGYNARYNVDGRKLRDVWVDKLLEFNA